MNSNTMTGPGTMLVMPERADRYNEGKVQLSFIFDAPMAMEGLCRRYELGAKKYARDNWKKGLPTKELIDCLLRHVKAHQNGEYMSEEFDKDGNSLGYHPHVDAIMWNAVVLAEQYYRGFDVEPTA